MLYHKDIYMPAELQQVEFVAMLRPTSHAIRESKMDRRGPFEIPKVFDTRKATLVEGEVKDGRVVKVVYRQRYREDKDIVMVINPIECRVITAWLNDTDDHHGTLDTSNYALQG